MGNIESKDSVGLFLHTPDTGQNTRERLILVEAFG